jgi:hypothetical protein
MRKDTALYFLLIGGFASLFLDIRYEHREVLHETWQAYIPLVASFVAIVTTLLAFSRSQATLRVSAGLYVLIAIVGLFGVYFHTKFRPYMFERYVVQIDESRGLDGKPKLKGLERPTFAPLAFSALGVVGLILVWPGFRWPNRKELPEEDAARELP